MDLIADIGGTNARFALIEKGSVKPQFERTLSCASYNTLIDAVHVYLEEVSQPYPVAAYLAVATPVTGDQISMTNHTWSFSVADTRKILQLDLLKVINDFTSLSLALPYLTGADYKQLGRGETVENQAMAVLGPGTGLGVSGAIPAGEYYLPIQGEGGHVAYGALNDREAAIIDVIRRKHHFISAELLVSGPGLVLLFDAIAECDDVAQSIMTPAEITEVGLNGFDPVARETLSVFCSILGTIAGNLALTLGARGGVFIGGGIVPRLGKYFFNSPFRQRFENHNRFADYLSAIPTFVIQSKYPALIGAAVSSMSHYQQLGITSKSI